MRLAITNYIGNTSNDVEKKEMARKLFISIFKLKTSQAEPSLTSMIAALINRESVSN